MNECPKCATPNKQGARFCSACGASLPPLHAAAVTEPMTGRKPAPVAPDEPPVVARPGRRPSDALLATGDLLDEERYHVTARVAQGALCNSYLVLQRSRRCPRCGRDYPPVASFCDSDGVRLAEEPAAAALLEEYLTAPGLAPVDAAAQLYARHTNLRPSLVNVRRRFVLQTNGGERTYVLKDPVLIDMEGVAPDVLSHVEMGRRLGTQAGLPPAEATALAERLAPALDALAEAGASLPGLSPAHVVLVGQAVRLDPAAPPGVNPFAPGQPGARAHADAQHVQGLAALLLQVSGGQRWPPAAVTLLSQAQRGETPGKAAPFVATLAATLREAPATAPLSGQPAATTVGRTLPAEPPAVAVGKLTDVGLVRNHNEDSLLTLELEQFHNGVATTLRLCAVADGMGGHAAGEVASKLALAALRDEVIRAADAAPDGGPPDLGAILVRGGQAAARAVAAQAQRTHSDMGTTLVAALVDAARMTVHAINVGDSRLYQVNAEGIRQVTKDHSLVQRLVDEGQITPAEARHHPNSNLIFRTLGGKPNVEIDRYDAPLAPGDQLLLCSDGLSGLVDDPDLHTTLLGAPSPQAACAQLIALAKAGGGHDNISAIVVSLAPPRGAPTVPVAQERTRSVVTQKLG